MVILSLCFENPSDCFVAVVHRQPVPTQTLDAQLTAFQVKLISPQFPIQSAGHLKLFKSIFAKGNPFHKVLQSKF